MSALADRLRGVVGQTAGRVRDDARRTALAETVDSRDVMNAAADVLGGAWCSDYDTPFLIVDRRYTGGHRHGRLSILDSLPPDSGAWRGVSLLGAGQGARSLHETSNRLVFLDLETTGLAGGAGTYAFLVGCAWFEGAAFRVRQFFLSSFNAERAILKAICEVAGDAAALVTFNGKTFDVPLIDTRFALHRLSSPFEELPHLDMLHVARRFWRQSNEIEELDADGSKSRGCRLSDLEQSVCGHEREGDVPGFEIPARYFHFVRTGDARGLEVVLEHNRLDLVSLALLTARAAQLMDAGPTECETAREALGLGTAYERSGLLVEARQAYAHAAGLRESTVAAGVVPLPGRDDRTRAEALRAYALLARRERRFQDAALAWTCALELGRCPPEIARAAAEGLAVHHEHRVRDLDVARRFALRSLQYRATPTRTQSVQHRLARLDRKLGQPGASLGLF